MKKYKMTSLLLACILSIPFVTAKEAPYTTQNPAYQLADKAVFGRLEHIYFTSNPKYQHIPFDGKIDTGADKTSIHGNDISVYSLNPKYEGLRDKALMKKIIDEYGGPKSFWWRKKFDTPERNLQAFVRFTAQNPETGQELKLERPLTSVSIIRSRTSEEPLYRPVIDLQMKIGNVEVITEANLTNREQFSVPILIGKSFLKQRAWVFTAYEYLQEQQDARVVGRTEVMNMSELPMDVSFSLTSRRSVMHASNIQIDKKHNIVNFETADNQGNKKKFQLPIANIFKISGKERAEVYIPVSAGEEFETTLLVYLNDRSKESSQLRLGTGALSQHFVVSANDKNLLSKPAVSFSEILKNGNSLVVSPEELLIIDGVEVSSMPDLLVQTPVLKVASYEISAADNGEQVTYFLSDGIHEQKKLVKPIIRKIKVNKSVRPIVEVQIELAGKLTNYEVAVEVLDKDEGKNAIFLFGQKMGENDVIINTRSEGLLQSHNLVKAGYVENVRTEGLTFPVKLDTGADVSSMHALDIKLYQKEGTKMVDFVYQNEQGQKKNFSRKVVRMMTITPKAGEKANHRPVVMMDVELGDVRKKIKVNLQDRSRFKYSMILGKNFLRYGVVVSSDDRFLLGK